MAASRADPQARRGLRSRASRQRPAGDLGPRPNGAAATPDGRSGRPPLQRPSVTCSFRAAFPDLRPDRRGYYSDAFQKWFGRHLRKVGAAAPRTSFHSTRHCFRDALREAGPRGTSSWHWEAGPGAGGAEDLYGGGLRAGMVLPSIVFELRVINLLRKFMELSPALGINPPVYAFLSMIGVRGCLLGLGGLRAVMADAQPLSQDVALVPEVIVEDFRIDPGRLLRPAFNVVWNAFGLPGSLNYDDQGNWRGYD